MRGNILKHLNSLLGISLLLFVILSVPAQIVTAANRAIPQENGLSCPVLDNLHVQDGGASWPIELAATLSDDFSSSTLDLGKWTSGAWAEGQTFTPDLTTTPGELTIGPNSENGGWVRSVGTFTHGEMQVTAQFTGDAWQNIGFASDGFANEQFLLFGTSTYAGEVTGDLYARANFTSDVYSEQDVDLGAIPSGMNNYRIEWTVNSADFSQDVATFYINGVQKAQLFVPNSGLPAYYLYLSNNGVGTLSVDYAQAAPTYVASGTYTSCVLDAGAGMAWKTLDWNATAPAGTTLTVKTSTSPDQTTWSAWSPVSASGDAIDQPDRYMQYQLTLTSDGSATPLVNSVTPTSGNGQVSLTIMKSGPDSVDLGGDLTYTLTVSNGGPNWATSLTVMDTLPGGVSLVSASGGGWDCSTSTTALAKCTLDTLKVTTAPVITINATAPMVEGSLSNIASVASEFPSDSGTSNTVATNVIAQADLGISQSASSPSVNGGANLTYTLKVTNNGPDTAKNVSVTDTLPTQADYVSAGSSDSNWACGQASGVVTCTRTSLVVGDAGDISVVVKAPVAGGTLSNAVSVSADTSDPVAENNTPAALETSVLAADLSINGTGSSEPVPVGGMLTYALNVSNSGPSDASNVQVSYSLPAGVSYVGGSGTGWTCDQVSGVVTCTLTDALVAGNSSTLSLQVSVPDQTGSMTSTFDVSSDVMDPHIDDNESSVSSTVIVLVYLPTIMR